MTADVLSLTVRSCGDLAWVRHEAIKALEARRRVVVFEQRGSMKLRIFAAIPTLRSILMSGPRRALDIPTASTAVDVGLKLRAEAFGEAGQAGDALAA